MMKGMDKLMPLRKVGRGGKVLEGTRQRDHEGRRGGGGRLTDGYIDIILVLNAPSQLRRKY